MNSNKQELEELYRYNVNKLYKFFYLKTLNRHTAEDLTSETFLRYADKLKTGKIDNSMAFLYGIAKNVFTEYLKKKYKSEIPVDEELIDFFSYTNKYSDQLSKADNLVEILIKLLPSLPKKQGEILKLRLVDKLTIKEICEKLKKPSFYVKTTQNRGIKTLKRLIAINKLTE